MRFFVMLSMSFGKRKFMVPCQAYIVAPLGENNISNLYACFPQVTV